MKKIAILSNLPSGGARTVYKSTCKYLKRRYDINELGTNLNSTKLTGIISYYQYVFIEIIKNYRLSKEINSKYDVLVAFQSWLTKSPIIFPLISVPIVYICNEVPREHYDPYVMSRHTIKEVIINRVMLLPIKIIDRLNIRLNNNLTIVTLSKISRSLIKKAYDIDPVIIHPGISLEEYRPYYEISKRQNQIITVGAINKYKNQLFVLQSVARVSKEIRPKVILVGNGGDPNYINELNQYAKANLIHLEIKMNIRNKDLIKLYKRSYALMYAPINEPYGLVVIEAISAGLPIIASNDGGGYLEIINSKNGYILSRDPLKWANAYTELYKDSTVWKKYSNYNYTISDKYTDSVYANKISNLIDELS